MTAGAAGNTPVLCRAGECPVCFFMDDIALVKNPATGLLFFYCHMCGCCWGEPPVSAEGLAEIVDPETLSPGGFVFPTEAEVADAINRLGWNLAAPDAPTDYWPEVFRSFVGTGLPVTRY
jgi:hypothetical protein